MHGLDSMNFIWFDVAKIAHKTQITHENDLYTHNYLIIVFIYTAPLYTSICIFKNTVSLDNRTIRHYKARLNQSTEKKKHKYISIQPTNRYIIYIYKLKINHRQMHLEYLIYAWPMFNPFSCLIFYIQIEICMLKRAATEAHFFKWHNRLYYKWTTRIWVECMKCKLNTSSVCSIYSHSYMSDRLRWKLWKWSKRTKEHTKRQWQNIDVFTNR